MALATTSPSGIFRAMPEPYWAVAKVQGQREAFAAGHLEARGFEIFLPKIETKRAILPLLPSYLFVRIVQRNAPGEDLRGVHRADALGEPFTRPFETFPNGLLHSRNPLDRTLDKAKAGRPPQNRSTRSTDYRGAPTLAELRISKDQSSRWQRLADVPRTAIKDLTAVKSFYPF